VSGTTNAKQLATIQMESFLANETNSLFWTRLFAYRAAMSAIQVESWFAAQSQLKQRFDVGFTLTDATLTLHHNLARARAP
jgi:hypothetical protein